MRSVSSSFIRALCVSAVLAIGAGCSGSGDAEDETDNAAVTAREANDSQHDLKAHVLVGVDAGPENAKLLGIAKWDVFAGKSAQANFTGAVFYASDPNGDVKYAFSVDALTKAVAFMEISKEGKPTGAKIEAAVLEGLTREIERLKEMLNAQARTTSGIGTRSITDCPVAIALAAVSAAAVIGAAVGIGPAVLFAVGAGLAVETAVPAALGSLAVLAGMGAWVAVGTGYAYVAYTVVTETAQMALDQLDQCGGRG